MKNNRSTNKTPILMAILLLDNFYSKEEIASILNIKQVTFFKNLQLLSLSGFEYIKENNKYKIVSFKNALQYSSLNTSTLAHLLTVSNNIFPKNKTKDLLFVFKKILYLSSKKDYDDFIEKYNLFNQITQNNKYMDKIELFQKYLKKNTILSVETIQKEKYTLKPLEFVWGQKKSFFLFRDLLTKEKRQIPPRDIISMRPTKEPFYIEGKKETVFELYGRMAKNYFLKEDEILRDVYKDKIVVINYSQDKQKLFKRLLRYDILCNIIYPKEDKIAFLNLLKKSLDNIG